jgi:MYXO-CTERM domain-containing protein
VAADVRGIAAVALGLLLAVPAPAYASGETLTASPTRGAPGASVHLDYETNYGPGGCERGQVVQLFFDASPLSSTPMDPSRCGAARTVRVPSGACGRHVFRAAWRAGGDPTLYGEATAAFVVLCKAEPTRSPTASPRPRATATRVVTAPPVTRSPAPVVATRTTAAPVVPVVTPTASPQAGDQDDSGTPWLLWALAALALAGAAVLVSRRRG